MLSSALSVTVLLGFSASLGKLSTCLCPGDGGLAALESAVLAGGRCIWVKVAAGSFWASCSC